MADRYRDDYSSRQRGGYGRSNESDRTVEGSGYAGRNWAERTGDEVASWVGDSDAEARRERDRQTIGRYPGEDLGERYTSSMGRGGYGDHRDQSAGYRGYDGDRTVQGSGAGGRNWAERTGDEVASWVGDSDAEQRRERDRQTIGRYPGEDRGERAYGGGQSGSRYGGEYRTVQGSGAGGRNWAERTGDEVASWVGDSDAEQRRERDRQTIGRYPGEDRGERAYSGSGYGSDRTSGGRYGSGSYGSGSYGSGSYEAGGSSGTYGAGSYGSSRYGEGEGYGGRTSSTSRGSNEQRGYGRDRDRDDYDADHRGFFTKAGDEVMSWFGDPEAERRRERDAMRSDAQGAFGGSSNSAGLGAASGYSASSFGHDPDYSAYRKARQDEYDRDYHEYKSGKTADFEKEFSSFRSTRSQTVASGGAGEGIAGQIREHAKVVGSDGQPVGEVDRVAGADIKLAKKDSPDGKHHLISIRDVASVDGDTVKLSRTAAEAKRDWRDGDSAAPGSATAGTASMETAKAY